MSSILGHTLGTPHLDVFGAIELFAAAELDGIEVIWQDGYRSAIPETSPEDTAIRVLGRARKAGLKVGCLTPYITDINSTNPGVRKSEIARYESAIRTAAILECPRIRVYGGTLLGHESAAETAERWLRLVESLAYLGDIAGRAGVTLSVENHFSTMTISASETARLITEVGSDSVSALYDQANLTFTHQEDYEQAIDLQAPNISHVHVKDLEFIDPNRVLRTSAVASIDGNARVHYSRMIGDGILDWNRIIAKLIERGYDGSYSLEYEYRWNPQDLPEPESGFAESCRRLRGILTSLQPIG